MGNNGVKSIVLIAILVVLSFLIGSQISNDKTVSFGIVAACVGLFLLLYLGARSWWLLFLAPLVGTVLPIKLPMPMSFLIAPVILIYWSLLNLMGYARFNWRTLWGADIPAYLFVIYTFINYYHHPSGNLLLDEIFSIDSELVGGREYVLCFFGFICYITVSLMPLRYKDCSKVIKIIFFFSIATTLFSTAKTLLFPGSVEEDMDIGDRAENTRFTAFTAAGMFLVSYLYVSTPFLKLIRKPFYVAAILMGCACVVISGWRNKIIELALRIFAIGVLKRELTLLICLGAMTYGALIFLSNEKLLNDLPYGAQRSLCAIPGVHVREDVERNASGSSNWRILMWRWALDARTGYIKDYVWGDGFAEDKKDMQRDVTAKMRGRIDAGNNQTYFAKHGVWHSGWITTMHRLGIIGLVLLILLQLSFIFYFYRFAFLLWKFDRKICFFYVTFTIAAVARTPLFHLSAGTVALQYFALNTLAHLKLYYCCAKEEFGTRLGAYSGRYVPLLIQEMNAPLSTTEPR